jgi:hypothetical protein
MGWRTLLQVDVVRHKCPSFDAQITAARVFPLAITNLKDLSGEELKVPIHES